MIEEDGKIRVCDDMIYNDGEQAVNFENEADKICKSTDEEILDLKFAKCYPLSLDMIYYRTASDEFVVPYFDCAPDSVSGTIKNGKSYTAAEFVRRLDCVVDLSQCSKPGMYGGGPFRSEALEYTEDTADENSTMPLLAIIASSLAAISGVIFVSGKIMNKKTDHICNRLSNND